MAPKKETVSLEQAKLFLADQYDPDEIVDLLNLSSIDLLDAFEDKVLEYANGPDSPILPTQLEFPFTYDDDKDDTDE
jgi:hypothetical protein